MTPEQRRDWRDYVLGAEALTLAQRVVLLALETFANYHDGRNARPGMDKLTQKCGLTDRAVEKALKRGRELGLIHRTANGYPGQKAEYCLVPVPKSLNGGTGISGESPNGEDINARTPVPPTTSRPHQKRGLRHGGTELDDPDAYAINPASGLRQSANGNATGKRCTKHAHIPDDEWVGENCRDCGALRKATKAFQADRKSAAIQTIKDCPHCDDLGRVEILVGGVEQLAPCPRHISWAQAQGGRTA